MSAVLDKDKAYIWHRALTKGGFKNEIPVGRAGHVQFVLKQGDPRIWIQGGIAENGEYKSDLYTLNTKTRRWNKVRIKKEPSSRAYHSLCICTPTEESLEKLNTKAVPRLFLYGGINRGQLKNEISLLENWSAFSSSAGNGFFEAIAKSKKDAALAWASSKDDFEEQGSVPIGRCNHTMSTLPGGRHLLMFGGWHSKFVNDLYLIDTETMTWTHKKPKSNPRVKVDMQIMPRAGHTAVIVPKVKIRRDYTDNFFEGPVAIFFGGQTNGNLQLDEVLVLDLINMEWHKPVPKGRCPVARSGHSAVYSTTSNRVLFFGGFDGSNVRNDFHILNVKGDMYSEWCWESKTLRGSNIRERVGHSVSLIGNAMWVFGGIGKDNQFLNDVLFLELPKVSVAKVDMDAQQASLLQTDLKDRLEIHKRVEENLEDKMTAAIQKIARDVQVTQAINKERKKREIEEQERKVREAQQKSVFTLVQDYGKDLDEALDIANSFDHSDPKYDVSEEMNDNLSLDLKQAIVPKPPKEVQQALAITKSDNSAWFDAVDAGISDIALEQIANHGGLAKTWGVLVDDEFSESEEEEQEPHYTPVENKYGMVIEKELKGTNLEALMQSHMEREAMFELNGMVDDQIARVASPTRRPKRIEVNSHIQRMDLALTTGDFSSELSRIATKGIYDEMQYEMIEPGERNTKLEEVIVGNNVPEGVNQAAVKIQSLMRANTEKRKYERKRAAIKLQANFRGFLVRSRLGRSRNSE